MSFIPHTIFLVWTLLQQTSAMMSWISSKTVDEILREYSAENAVIITSAPQLLTRYWRNILRRMLSSWYQPHNCWQDIEGIFCGECCHHLYLIPCKELGTISSGDLPFTDHYLLFSWKTYTWHFCKSLGSMCLSSRMFRKQHSTVWSICSSDCLKLIKFEIRWQTPRSTKVF